MKSERVFEVFDAVSDLPANERRAALARLCGDDAALLHEVRTLLASDEDPVTGIEERPVRRTAGRVPETIGEYEVLGLLGSGGMGVVYEAMQRSPHRKVALKLVRSTLVTPAHVKRFESEAQVLGWLNHPGIATVYEAGTAEVDGALHPYLAMELVVGFPLDRYANEGQLSIEERALLVARVADAVHHAHQKGVVHRDLKPGNVLVDASGQPKVLDFGIARVTDADLSTATRHTTPGEILGTLPYMSPEQVQGDPAALDTRADVYALGVVLYELLSGKKPLDLTSRAMAEAARIIVEEEPVPLSRVDARLKGDLEIIAQKALEKDKERRYDSAAALAADLRRYLSNEPIHARPASAAYQFQKFARRNRLLVGGALSTLVALVAGLIGTLTFAGRASDQADVARGAEQDARDAEREARDSENVAQQRAEEARIAAELANEREREARDARDRADASAIEARRQADVANAVNAFLNEDLLATVAPSVDTGRGKDVKMRDVLDVAAQRIDEAALPGGRFGDKPTIEAEIRSTLGNTYWRLGEFDLAARQLERARDLFDGALGPDALRTLMATGDWAWMQVERRVRLDEAEMILRETGDALERVLGEAHEETLSVRRNLGTLLMFQTRYAEAAEINENTLALADETLGPWDPLTIGVRTNLGTIYGYQLRFEEAEETLKAAIEAGAEVLGNDHPDVLTARDSAAAMAMRLDRNEEAEALYREVVATDRRVLGEEHPQTMVATMNLAVTLLKQTKLDEGEEILRGLLDTQRRVLGDAHSNTLYTQNALGELVRQQGDNEECVELLRGALDALRRNRTPEPVLELAMRTTLLYALGDLGRWSELEEHAARLDDDLAQVPNPDARIQYMIQELSRTLGLLAWNLLIEEGGEAAALRALDAVERALELANPVTADLLDTLALAYYRLDRLQEAYDTQLEALDLAPESDASRAEMEERMAEYEAALADSL